MFRLLIILIACLVLFSCKTTKYFVMLVNSRTSAEASSMKKYLLAPGDKGIEIDSLEFREYSKYVKRGLDEKGFTEANGTDSADIVILLSYGIREVAKEAEEPVYEKQFAGYRKKDPLRAITRGVEGLYSDRDRTRQQKLDDFDRNNPIEYVPYYENVIVDYRTVQYYVYDRHLLLTAYDVKEYFKTKKEKKVWEVLVKSQGSGSDLRKIFPALVAGSYDYFSGNTRNEIEVKLLDDDSKISYIKGH